MGEGEGGGPEGEGISTTTTYDTQGRRTAETDALGRTTEYEYDPRGNLKTVLLPAVPDPEDLDTSGNPILKQPRYDYEYDVYGNHVLIRDPKGRETRFTYDELGRQTGRSLPEFIDPATSLPRVVTESTTYDALGRVATRTDFAGQVTEYVYTDPQGHTDVLGRVLFVNYYESGSSTPDETWSYSYDAYDAQGFRHDSITQTAGSESRTTENVYDRQGQLVQIITPEGTLNYDYDPATGRRTQVYTTSTDVTYDYDQLGRLTTVTQVMRNGETLAVPEVTRYQYDPLGNLLRTDLPNGVASIYEYDALNRLEKLTHGIPNAVDPDVLDTVLAEFDYELGADGKREALTERIRLNDGSYRTETIDWDYDAVGRLTSERHDSSATGEDFAIDYVYDLVGNRLQKSTMAFDDAGASISTERSDYTYNALDQLLSEATFVDDLLDRTTLYGYDYNGSQTTKVVHQGNETGPVLESASYDYNLQGRLFSATIDRTENGQPVHIEAGYRYNPDGIRVVSDTTTTIDNGTPTVEQKVFLIDPNNPTGYAQVLEEWLVDPANPAVRSLALSYLIGLDVLSQASALSAPSAVRLFLADGLGSTRLLTDPAAAITDRYFYDAYGNLLRQPPIGPTNLPSTSLLYTGERFDPNLLSYYLRARYYDPATGHFNRLDPFLGTTDMPQSLHRYGYVHADPIGHSDPTGEAIQALILLGLVLGYAVNIGFLLYDLHMLQEAIAEENSHGIGVYSAFLFVDTALLLLPGSGPFRGAGQVGVEVLLASGGSLALKGGINLTAEALKVIILSQTVAGDLRALYGGARGIMAMANADSTPPNGTIVPEQLTRAQSNAYRVGANKLWKDLTGLIPGQFGWAIHHRIPLEWAHIFPRSHPNRIGNIPVVSQQTHTAISRMWDTFRAQLAGREPSQREVVQQAMEIDKVFGNNMRFIDRYMKQQGTLWMDIRESVQEMAHTLYTRVRQSRIPDWVDPSECQIGLGIDDARIDAFEARTAIRVPLALREWLKFVNGAPLGFGGVYGIQAKPRYRDIEAYYVEHPVWLSKEWIPIAGDGCGNSFLLVTREDDGPGEPVLFVNNALIDSEAEYVVASDLWHFLRFYLGQALGEEFWPFDGESVLSLDPALTHYRNPKFPLPWTT